MSRTERRGYNVDTKEMSYEKNRPDWRCKNPECCGNAETKRMNKRARHKARAQLRRDPESMSNKPAKEY